MSTCPAFAWVGQTFASCDECGEPYWNHTHRYAVGVGEPFGGGLVLVPITAEEAEAARRKWSR